MSGALTLVPLALFAAVGVVVAALVLTRRTPAGQLSLPVLHARRRSALVATLALALTAAALAAGLSLQQNGLRETQLIAATPLLAAALHTLALLAGELTWPRPNQRVRSAHLAVRTAREQAPRGALRTFAISAALLRVTTAALLGTTAALWFFGGNAAARTARGVTYGVEGTVVPGPLWNVLGTAAVIGGVALLLAALTVLLVPARGLRRDAAVRA